MYGPPNAPRPAYPSTAPRPPSSARRSAWWLLGAAVTVIAAAVIITLVITGGGGSPTAGGTSAPGTTSAAHTSAAETSGTVPSQTDGTGASLGADPTGAPTTDALPSNSASGSCGQNVQPGLVAVAVATTLGLSAKGEKPNSYVANVLHDCTSAAVRSRIELLLGIQFGTDYSGDLSGGDNRGPTAQYRVSNAAGTGTLELTLTRQDDGHYEVTGFSYSG